MKLKEKDFKLIKINFEYKNQAVSIIAEPYKTFEEIKYLALNKYIDIFSSIPNNLHFYYYGKDLMAKEQEKIGNMFNHKEQISIIIRLPDIKLNLKKNKNHQIDTNFMINYQNKFLSSEQTQYNIKSLKTMKSMDKTKYKSKDMTFNINKSNSMSYLPALTKRYKNNDYNIFNNINFDDIGNYTLCDNHQYKVSEYCRPCKKFICEECTRSLMHEGHLTITLNFLNLEESIKLYISMIQINEKKNLKKINANYLNNDADNDDIINFENEEEIIVQKIEKIINKYHSFMKKIDKNIENEKNKYRTMIINNFNDVASRISMEINTTLTKFDNALKKNQNKFTLEEIQFYLDEISKKEETLELIRERTIKYLLTFEINNKLESTFELIESTLDSINNEENPFNLEEKYNKELMKMINLSNNNNINKNMNNSDNNIINTNNENNKKNNNKGILKNKKKKHM
jgi:hypothetical protein